VTIRTQSRDLLLEVIFRDLVTLLKKQKKKKKPLGQGAKASTSL
jgi:hypothetical protein